MMPDGKQKDRRVAAVYDYRDGNGATVYQVVRFEPKGFAQRLPDGTWGLNKARRLPYRLPELLAAPSETMVFIPEGEKDADRLVEVGLTATCNSGGAGKWLVEFNAYFAGRDVVVLADNDGPGLAHAEDVARNLCPVGRRVRVVWLPSLQPKGDVSDWLDAGHTLDELYSIIEQTPTYELSAPEDVREKEIGFPLSAPKPTKNSQAARLVELLPDDAHLFHAPDGVEHAVVSVRGHRETHRIKSTSFRKYLSREFYMAEGRASRGQVLNDAINLICAKALFDGPEQEVYLRTAPREGGGFWIDLCDPQWSAIEVTANYWRVVENPPVRFLRKPGMLTLPVPNRGGSLGELDHFINVKSDDDRVMIYTIITSYMRPSGPYVLLCINGEHGTAKSTAARVIRSFIDPSAAPLSGAPHDERDLVISASNSWLISLDNLSKLDGWLSDALCRLATGGGLRTRTLYTDTEETIFDAQRPIILNGIESLATRGDLVDRSVTINLSPIEPEQRREESEFWLDFEAARPRILGALLDVIVGGLRKIDTGIRLARKPRMADFAVWGVAVEAALGFDGEAFIAAYEKNRGEANTLALESSSVSAAIMAMMSTRTTWTGTAGELLKTLFPYGGTATTEKSWPRSPRGLRGALERLAPNLREAGIQVTFDGPRGHSNRRIIEIARRQTTLNTVRTERPVRANANDTSQVGELTFATSFAASDLKDDPACCANGANGQEQPLSAGLGAAARPGVKRKVRAEL
jgi:hypothetical protein